VEIKKRSAILMEVSNLFVCIMGMGVTFVGLSCIILLTWLMGRIMNSLEKKQPAAPDKSAASAAPAAPAAPAVPADGLTDEVKVAILAALAQEPGFRLANVTNVSIRRV
jgi:sodium pump decarboxylase gamma subunit